MSNQETASVLERRTASLYVTREAAQRAVEMVMPMIEAALRDPHVIGSGCLHVVILDPAISPYFAKFEEAILHEYSFGKRERRDADYAAFARAKAELSWRARMDSHQLQSVAPHLLRADDSLLWGSVWLDGLVVGVSGAFPWYDEAFAGAIAYALRALAKEARAAAA